MRRASRSPVGESARRAAKRLQGTWLRGTDGALCKHCGGTLTPDQVPEGRGQEHRGGWAKRTMVRLLVRCDLLLCLYVLSVKGFH